MARRSPSSISRRTFVQSSAFAAIATWSQSRVAGTLLAQQVNDAEQMRAAGASAKVSVYPLRRTVSVLMGSGGNIIVLPGTGGKVLVDAGYATSQKQIGNALSAISNQPLNHLIDTHWHFDHTDGNEWIHAAGATIVGHENTRRRLSTPQQIPAFRGTFPASPAGALPTIVFGDRKTLHLNDEEILLEYYGPAHSDSDISVRLVRADILHTGDTWFNGFYPFIDYYNGGSFDGLVASAARNLRSVDDHTVIVPGHGPVGKKAQLVEYDDMLRILRERITRLKKQGRSLEETIAAKPSASFDAKWGGGLVPPDAFVELVYAGV
jgi:glyoxylase-like metal-dependent hydrolase (beta-lactamase superfamily II)